MKIFFLALLVVSQAFAACSNTAPNQWHCAATGNPTADGEALWNFLNETPFACGDTIVLDAGASYIGIQGGVYYFPFRLKPQKACGTRKTEIVSSMLATLAPGRRVVFDDRKMMPKLVGKAPFGEPSSTIAFDAMGINMYAFRGIAITTHPDIAAVQHSYAGKIVGSNVESAPDRKLSDNESDIEFDRCLIYPAEEESYGPMGSNSQQASYFRSASIGMSLIGTRYSIHESAIVGFGGFNPATTTSAAFTAGTEASRAVLTSRGIAAAFGLQSGVSSCATGCTGSCYAYGGCRFAVFSGAAGSWSDLNGLRYVIYSTADSIAIGTGGPFGFNDPKWYDSRGLGAMPAGISARLAVPIDPSYALAISYGKDFSIVNNLFDGGQMVIFTGGASITPTDNRGIIQAGSTATALILNNVSNLQVGDLISIPTGSRSAFCPNSGKGCWYVTTQIGKVVAIDGMTVSITPWGPSGVSSNPVAGGSARWNGNNLSMEFRRNTVRRSDSVIAVGKGYLELKTCDGCLIDGNIFTDTAGGDIFLTARNQGGGDPWIKGRNLTFSNNLIGGKNGAPRNLLFQGEDDEITSSRSSNIWWENNLLANVRFPDPTTSSPFVTSGMFSNGGGTNDSGWRHNTALPMPGQAQHVAFRAPACYTPYNLPNPIPGDYLVPHYLEVYDNIVAYGEGIELADPSCWSDQKVSFNQNLFVATGSVSAATIKKTWPSNAVVSSVSELQMIGACTFETWENCALAPTSPYKGTATDGKDPGTDILQIKDRMNGWSEYAGLLVYDSVTARMVNNPKAFQIGATSAAMSFRPSGDISGCKVTLYWNGARTEVHADTADSGQQSCGRSSSVSGELLTFAFGTNSPLSPSTTYYYKIEEESRVMTGEFTTAKE